MNGGRSDGRSAFGVPATASVEPEAQARGSRAGGALSANPSLALRAPLFILLMAGPAAGALPWNSQNRYRTLLTVNPNAATRSHCPAAVDLDFPALLAGQGATGTFDEHTIEVVAYDANEQPVVYDVSRGDLEKYLVPWRIDKLYRVSRVTLNFVIPNQTCTRFAVYFDTLQSGRGKPQRYAGLVGDGDYFREEYKRREINASHFDHFCDFDGDGDLDLFKGGVEPYCYVYENVGGGNRMVERGRLTSGGNLLTLPNAGGRSWLTVAFCDWDGDGDQDLFPSFGDGPDAGKIVYYRNTTAENGGVLTFTRVGVLTTAAGTPVAGGAQAGGWFPSICFVQDWDGDGDHRTDILVGSNNHCYLYRNIGSGPGGPQLAEAVAVQAAGQDIVLSNPRFDVADIDNDGDLDLFAGCQPGEISWFRNTGTRTAPVFAAATIVAYPVPILIADAHSGVKVADFDGDGLLDLVAGRFWERTPISEADQPRYYGGLHKNIGTAANPAFERRGADQGSPFTERFQPCDAVRQNSVRMVDWDNDGQPDLLGADTDGFVYLFRNLRNRLYPVFATGERLRTSDGQLLTRYNSGGHARPDVADWNNDGKKDLVISDGSGNVVLHLNTGTDAAPVLAPPQALSAGGVTIQIGSRSSVMVCDYNRDGKKDLVTADQETGYKFFRNTGTDAAPVLAAAQAITFNGQPVTYVRPNLGSYLDWDGDGKFDLIGCHFENTVRFYKNIGSGAAGQLPQYSSPEGQTILSPFTVQMISGADAKDWRGDGDADILTGQGHGGSYLRFYERDQINNLVGSSFPTVTVGETESNPSVSRSDLDGDGDADQSDFAIFQICIAGPTVSYPPGCEAADLTGDGSVDSADLALFVACLNGSNRPPAC